MKPLVLRGLWGVVLGGLGFALGLELLLRVLPVSTATQSGYRLDPLIQTYPPQHRWVSSTGWDLRRPHTLQANNLGFLADRDFVPNPQALVLIGDSFVEATMLDAEARPGAQLERALGGSRQVYAMGGAGSALLDYAERVRYAYQQLGVRDFVIQMEGGDVRQSLCGSGNVHGPCLDRETLVARVETVPPPSAAKRLLRHSALAQYVVGQLKVDFPRLAATAFKRNIPETASEKSAGPETGAPGGALPTQVRVLPAANEAYVAAVTDAFWQRIHAAAPQARLLFVVGGGRAPAAGSVYSPSTDIALERSRFIEIARARGHTVVDGEQVFAAHVATSPLSLSVGPDDGHMNGYAVGLLMRATAQALR
jgi:hypothetical protein